MQDLFTVEDRERLNAAMAAGSGDRYAELLAADPAPSRGMRIGLAVGLGVLGLIIGGVLTAVLGVFGLIALVILVAAGVVLSRPLARHLHEGGLRGQAEQEVVGGYVTERGWRMVEQIPVPAATPLLREGDERATGWGVTGSLDPATAFVAGHYEYTEVRTVTDTDSEGRTTTREERSTYPFSVVLIPAPGTEYQALSLARGSTGGFMSRISGAISDMKPVELESSEFNDEFRLMVDDAVDEVAVRTRFSPVVQVAFVERGAGDVRIELEADQLVVARAGAPDLDDLGGLVDLLGDAIWLRAVLTEDPPGRLPEIEPLRRLLLGGPDAAAA
ncbi:MAG: hypothetical protein ACKO7Q_11550 [Actinomycetota bacterium]